jgi:hypothetical protein
MAQNDWPLIVYPSRWKLLAILLGSMMFVAAGIAAIAFRRQLDTPLWVAILLFVLAVPFFSVATGYSLFRLVVWQPSLIIDDRGIVDHASLFGAGFIAWDEIRHLVCYSYGSKSQRMLGVVPKDPEVVYARIGWKARVLRLNARIGAVPISIAQVTLPIRFDELSDRLERFCPVVRDALVPEATYRVEVSDSKVVCWSPDGSSESVQWDDLQQFEIVTTDEGPYATDVYWVLHGSETGCVIPQGATGDDALLRRLETLPGSDRAAFARAMGSTSNQRFSIWSRTSAE